jgi:hypothetical protein
VPPEKAAEVRETLLRAFEKAVGLPSRAIKSPKLYQIQLW